MHGLMMDWPLTIAALLKHAECNYHDQEIVSRDARGEVLRCDWRGLGRRARRLANALRALGIEEGDRVGTIAWNDLRHVEVYYAVSGMGAVCHTLNPRLHPDQLRYIVNHARDRYLLVDPMFLPLLEAVAGELESLEGVIVMTDREGMPETGLANALCYEELVEAQKDGFVWPELDERTASSLCYTSGTTGNPKGVLFSHRSTVLHSYAISVASGVGLREREPVLPVVPMFHVNAWGLPYAAALVGFKLVLPGPKLDGRSLTQLMCAEGVGLACGVPTVWLELLEHWRESGERVPSLERVAIGGSAVAPSMLQAFEEDFGIEVIHAWGMTETSPLGTVSNLKPGMQSWGAQRRQRSKLRQGRPPFGVEMRIVDEEGRELVRDGQAFGELQVKGPWVCSGYFGEEASGSHDAEGWFGTGDVATIDGDGFMTITDRKKDVIKSGGEWISSIELENVAMSHAGIAHAAVIGVPHEKWLERPLLIAVPREGAAPSEQEVLAHFEGKVAKWWIPEQVVFVESLPIGATGKVQKRKLREVYG